MANIFQASLLYPFANSNNNNTLLKSKVKRILISGMHFWTASKSSVAVFVNGMKLFWPNIAEWESLLSDVGYNTRIPIRKQEDCGCCILTLLISRMLDTEWQKKSDSNILWLQMEWRFSLQLRLDYWRRHYLYPLPFNPS